VHGIINIQDEGKDNLLLLVHHLNKASKSRADRFLPYELYQYDFQFPQWDIIEPSMIYRPAMIIPCFDRSNGFDTETYNSNTSKNLRMWIVPYHFIDVNGHEISEILDSEIINMEHIFNEINENLNINQENDEDGTDDEDYI
jgi:hypothetical protein